MPPTNPTHTPGPWHIRESGKSLVVETRSCVICRCTDNAPMALGERDANARLIAAAPALLEALGRALELCTAVNRGDPEWTAEGALDQIAAAARAAIDKATKG